MRKRMMISFAIGIGIATAAHFIGSILDRISSVSAVTFCNAIEIAVIVVCTGVILYKLDSIKKD